MKILRSFKGGIHPPDSKHQTEHAAIERMPLPSRVVIPLQQHLGAPCEPLVKVGDEVQEGQKIGEPKGFVSAPVHASISGTVAAIENLPHPVIATAVRSIVIESSVPSTPRTWEQKADWSTLSAQDLLTRIKDAGIVGMGGATFPSHIKLAPPKQTRVDTLIVNGVECEPYLTADHRLMLERPADILEGLKIVLNVLGIKRAYLGIEKNKPDAIQILQQQVAKTSDWNGATVEVFPLNVKYPQGAEKQLIKAIVGKEVPSGGLPFDVGVVVHNVGTIVAIYEAVVMGKPLFERIVTVGGPGVKTPKNLLVRLGTPFASVIDYAGGLVPSPHPLKTLMGGPMMGIAQYTLDVPVIKGTSGILVLEESKTKSRRPCIKCGACVRGCPIGLMPTRLASFAERHDFAECDAAHVRDCIECGACTFSCPSGIPIVHLIKYAKLNLSKPKKP